MLRDTGFKSARWTLATVIFALGSSGSSFGERVLGSAEIEKLQQSFKIQPEMSIDFTQTQVKKLRGKTSTSLGRAYFKQPDSFRWQLISPKQDEWLYDGKNLYNFIPDRLQATRYDANGTKGRELRQIVDLVTNISSLTKSYEFTEVKEVGPLLELTLTPKMKGELAGVTLTIIKDSLEPKSLILRFQNDNPTKLEFSRLAKGGLSESTFSIPKGVSIETVK
jgi:outer membrane lipoprotein-sorting protein